MSRPTPHHQRRTPVPPQLPTPPPGGWSYMEALEILCPKAMHLYRRGGAELRALALTALPPWDAFHPDPSPDPWLEKQLLAALCARPDLQLTGRNLAKGVDAERFRLPHDLLLAAVKEDDGGYREFRLSLHLSLRSESARIQHHFTGYYDPEAHAHYPETPAPLELIAVRIEATRVEGAAVALPLGPTAPVAAAGAATKPEFSEAALRGWFVLRVRIWPKDQAAPTRDDCWAEACAYFGRHIPRDTLRRIRRDMVPAPWKKTGRRRPPNERPQA